MIDPRQHALFHACVRAVREQHALDVTSIDARLRVAPFGANPRVRIEIGAGGFVAIGDGPTGFHAAAVALAVLGAALRRRAAGMPMSPRPDGRLS